MLVVLRVAEIQGSCNQVEKPCGQAPRPDALHKNTGCIELPDPGTGMSLGMRSIIRICICVSHYAAVQSFGPILAPIPHWPYRYAGARDPRAWTAQIKLDLGANPPETLASGGFSPKHPIVNHISMFRQASATSRKKCDRR